MPRIKFSVFLIVIIVMPLFLGCAALRKKGNIELPQPDSTKPSVYLTADFTYYNNGQEQAYWDKNYRKKILQKMLDKMEECGLFGPVTTEKNDSLDFHFHCDVTLEITHRWSDFWLSVFLLELYPNRHNHEYTMRTKVKDMRTGKANEFVASDLLTIYSSIWLIPVSPFLSPMQKRSEVEQYLFNSTIKQMVSKGIFEDKAKRTILELQQLKLKKPM